MWYSLGRSFYLSCVCRFIYLPIYLSINLFHRNIIQHHVHTHPLHIHSSTTINSFHIPTNPFIHTSSHPPTPIYWPTTTSPTTTTTTTNTTTNPTITTTTTTLHSTHQQVGWLETWVVHTGVDSMNSCNEGLTPNIPIPSFSSSSPGLQWLLHRWWVSGMVSGCLVVSGTGGCLHTLTCTTTITQQTTLNYTTHTQTHERPHHTHTFLTQFNSLSSLRYLW